MFTIPEPIPRKHQVLRHQRQAVWSCRPEQPWQEQSLPMSILYGPLYVNTYTSFNSSYLYLILWKQASSPSTFDNCFPIELLWNGLPLSELSSLRRRQPPPEPFSDPVLGHSLKASQLIPIFLPHHCKGSKISKAKQQKNKLFSEMIVKYNPQTLWRH